MLEILALSAFDAGRMAGGAILAILLVALVRRAARKRAVTDWIAAAAVAVLLAGALLRAGGDDAWASGEGAQLRAGFIAGCESSAGSIVDCGCVFTELTSAAPYDTPAGFATLHGPVSQAQQTGDLSLIPQPYIAAANACRR
jgi:hypothetical protein